VIGTVHGTFAHLPLALVTGRRKQVSPDGSLWLSVTEATGQPLLR
jgi:hypothetical protein